MRGRTSSIKISLTSEQRETKESWLRRQRPLLDWPNARAVLLLAEESASKPVNGLDSENAICEWARRTLSGVLKDCKTVPDQSPVFSPQVALYLVKVACELPDTQGDHCAMDCTELARQVVSAGLVGSISAATVRRILKVIT